MAEIFNSQRDWRAGIDPALVSRLQRPLRRSAAHGCAWAREALARAQLGELPMFAGWLARWGMSEAAIAGLRPVVHAVNFERSAEAGPRVPTVAGRVVSQGGGAVSVVAREVLRREVVERGGDGSGERPGVGEMHRASAASAASTSPPVVPRTAAPAMLDLRVDPSLLVAPVADGAVTGPIAMTPMREDSSLPARPRTRPRLVTPMELAREQRGAAMIAAAGAVVGDREVDVARAAGPIVATRSETTGELVVRGDDGARAESVVGTLAETASPTMARSESGGAAMLAVPIVAQAAVSAGPIVHASVAATSVSSASEVRDAGAPTRVRGRVLVAPVAPVLTDSPSMIAVGRPRVSAAAPIQPAPTTLTGIGGPSSAPPDGSRMDLGLPSAVASKLAPTPAPTPAAPPTPQPQPQPSPVSARVETSQLDIPAIAQAVHRHLERELRWERERRGGRS